MKFKSDSSVSRVMKNGVFTTIQAVVYTLMGILFVPFLRNHYGDNTYGLIALAGFLTQYIGFIAGCIGSSIGRFLNIALNKNDWKQANEIYSTALVANGMLSILQIPFYAWAIWKLDRIIDFPPDVAVDFRIMVICNVAAFLLNMSLGVLLAPLHAANRIDITTKINIVAKLLRVTLLVSLILGVGPRLWIIGVVDLFIVCAGFCVDYYFNRKFARDLVFRWKHVAWKWVKPVMGMASWSVIAGLGQILFQKTDVWIINRFVDPALAGVCAALLVWPNFVQYIAKNASALIMPAIMIDYAQERFQRVRDIVLLGTSIFSLMSLFFCGAVMVFGGRLLELWMQDETYRQYHWFLILMLVHYPLTLGREALYPLFPAFNKMNYLGVSNIITGVLNIILSLGLVSMGYGLAGVIIATGFCLVLQRTVFLSIFAARLLEIKYRRFLGIYVPGFLLCAAVALQLIFFKSYNFMIIGVVAIVASLAISLWLCIHDSSVKNLMRSMLGVLKGSGSGTIIDT